MFKIFLIFLFTTPSIFSISSKNARLQKFYNSSTDQIECRTGADPYVISFKPWANSTEFHVDLYNREDIVLHIKPRYKNSYTVFNAFIDGKWGPEDRTMWVPGRDEEFELRIAYYSLREEFMIHLWRHLGGQQYRHLHRYKFASRAKTFLASVPTRIEIGGDVELMDVNCF